MTVTGAPGGGVQVRTVGRYALEDLVAEGPSWALWRARDPALRRSVAVRLVAADHPRVDDIRAAARAAATIGDRRVVHLLDVLDVPGLPADQAGRGMVGSAVVALVSEWVVGRPWSEIALDGSEPRLVARVALEVTRALQSAAEVGIGHGRLRPASVLITDNDEVRVRGVGIDGALWGSASEEPVDDEVAGAQPAGRSSLARVQRLDVQAVGGILYAGLTRRWPGGPADGLAAAPVVGGVVPEPSRIVADVPARLDEITARALAHSPSSVNSGAAQNAGPRRTTRLPYADLTELATALSRALESFPADAAAPSAIERRWPRRLAGLTTAFLLIGGVGFTGWHLVTDGSSPWGAQQGAPSTVLAAEGTDAPAVVTPPSPVPDQESALPVVSIRDFDPDGNGQENPSEAPLAIDGDSTTAWTTVRYRTPELSGKPGVGLLLDLGTPRPVSSVNLQLVGDGTDLQIRTAEQESATADGYIRFASALGAGSEITLRTPTAVTARYILVWLTKVPADNGSNSGGVREVTVRG